MNTFAKLRNLNAHLGINFNVSERQICVNNIFVLQVNESVYDLLNDSLNFDLLKFFPGVD
jgi:hypothetical protein